MWAEEGQTATLVCITAGQPAPTITWSKVDGGLGSNSQKDGKLTLSRVELESRGTYRCEANKCRRYKGGHSKDQSSATSSIQCDSTETCYGRQSVPHPAQLPSHFPAVLLPGNDKEAPCLEVIRLISTGLWFFLNVSDESAGVYVCKASTRFRSVNTTTQVKVTYRSCSHLKAAFPSKISDNYAIDPDGEGVKTLS